MASSARIDELRKKFDENPRRYFAPLANEYRKAGDLEQAIFICQEYLPQQPAHMSGHIVYGQALYELSRFDEARVVFETALSLDPENLIALRHLGDIARQAGDVTIARMWYQRVLEADPRNEEITQLIQSLAEAAPADSAAASTATESTPAAAPAAFASGPESLTPPELPSAAEIPTPAAAAPVAPTEPDLPPPLPIAESALEAVADPFAVPELPPPLPSSAPAEPSALATNPPPAAPPEATADAHELLDLDSDAFSLPATEPSAPAATSASAEPPPFDAMIPDPFATPANGAATGIDIERAADSPSLETAFPSLDTPTPFLDAVGDATAAGSDASDTSDPFAFTSTFAPEDLEPTREDAELADVAATPASEAPIELATDLILGLPDAPSTPEPSLLEETVDVTPDAGFDLPVDESLNTPAAAPSFVTETMATLYLEQGHLDRAIDIYRQLVAQRPDDVMLGQRLQELEARADAERVRDATAAAEPMETTAETFGALSDEGAPSAEAASSAPTNDVPAPQTYGGPTIREFLSGLLARQTPVFADEQLGAVAVEEESAIGGLDSSDLSSELEPAFDTADSEEIAAPAPSPEPPATANAPRRSGENSLSGSIGVLFSEAAAEPTPSEPAADVAPTNEPEATPLAGEPAHRATSELSLDHVFKSGSPQRRESDEFSFDQFFAEDAGEARTTPVDGTGTATPPEASEDIAQFNSWLNGLKKT